MSMHPQPISEIPADTMHVVRAAFPKGNLYIHLRDALGTIYQDGLFADLYPGRGQPAYAPWRLALVTVFQFLENLTDRQAADAVRSRLDWKYALSLELTDPGFDHTVLSEFRTRLSRAASWRARTHGKPLSLGAASETGSQGAGKGILLAAQGLEVACGGRRTFLTQARLNIGQLGASSSISWAKVWRVVWTLVVPSTASARLAMAHRESPARGLPVRGSTRGVGRWKDRLGQRGARGAIWSRSP
jgi:transposase